MCGWMYAECVRFVVGNVQQPKHQHYHLTHKHKNQTEQTTEN